LKPAQRRVKEHVMKILIVEDEKKPGST
jgi:hypothetical protein